MEQSRLPGSILHSGGVFFGAHSASGASNAQEAAKGGKVFEAWRGPGKAACAKGP
jgi:hypothetical protein